MGRPKHDRVFRTGPDQPLLVLSESSGESDEDGDAVGDHVGDGVDDADAPVSAPLAHDRRSD